MSDLLFSICVYSSLIFLTIVGIGFGLHADLQKILKELQRANER